MKNYIPLLLITCLFIGCQKELGKPISSVPIPLNTTTSSTDSIIFDAIPDGNGDDDGSGRFTCFITPYSVQYDSIYAKEFIFAIDKSSGVTITKAKLYLDGIRAKTINYTGNVDTIDFFKVVPSLIDPSLKAYYGGKHDMAVKLEGSGTSGSTYRIKLVKAVFVRKQFTGANYIILQPPPDIFNLPQTGWLMRFV